MSLPKVTAEMIRAMKGKQRIPALTAYDYPMTKLLDETGVPWVILLGWWCSVIPTPLT
jgi:ketopantoate hydroxymethyltransferase